MEVRRMRTPKLILMAGLFLIPSVILAQGTIRGTVADSVSHERLVGVNVFVVGTSLGNPTNIEGQYRITRIPSGSITVRASYLGYRTKDLRLDITGDTTLNFGLVPDVIEGEEILVTAQARGQIAAMNQQINATTIVNVISEEKIQELPDVNAAEAIGRLPGVSILRSGGEANKVILRGMSDKFTSITVDGVRIAATDANERGVDLSTISQGSLSGIEVFKALTSDKDAEAIAGSVNLVTRKAPSERLVRLDSKGAYGGLNKTFKQYEFHLRYGERFFDDVFGVQLVGNLELWDRSKEVTNTAYTINTREFGNVLTSYDVRNFDLQYTDEDRGRRGFSVLLDVNTPDSGSIRFDNVYNKTNRAYTLYKRSYTVGNDAPVYSARDVEEDIGLFNSSIRGENHALGLDATWGLSFAQSVTEDPYDFELLFHEPSSDSSGMKRTAPAQLKSSPEQLIPYAWNNFSVAVLDTAYFRYTKNRDKEQTAYLDIKKDYLLSDAVSGELKFGGRYRAKTRSREASTIGGAYWLSRWSKTERLPDGTLRQKSLQGTRFANMLNQNDAVVSMAYFLDNPPANRDLYGSYALYPMINRDALREWYDLNKYGASGVTQEYQRSVEDDGDYYDVEEHVSAGYLMNSFNLGQWMTAIAGVRVESENNDYKSRYTPSFVMQFPNSGGPIYDTTLNFKETIWLPNFQATFRLTDFMNLRLAAFRSLARPDFNNRLEKFLAVKANTGTLTVGNPNLQAAKAWNYEVNTSFFGGDLGLVSVSAFYKDISDMYHMYNQVRTKGSRLLDSLGIQWRNPFEQHHDSSTFVYFLTYPFNSSRPTKVWGLEFEHQANLNFLPGVLSNFVLNYNFSFIRSETYQVFYKTRKDSVFVPDPEFGGVWVKFDVDEVYDAKTRLENQPEFFANIALGYDIDGFSGRLSFFHQGEYTRTFTARSRGDIVVGSFSRLDLSLKQKITDNISVMLNVTNLTNTEEPTAALYGETGWDLPRTRDRYGMSGVFGVRVEL
jgi:TonB-dependent receptor